MNYIGELENLIDAYIEEDRQHKERYNECIQLKRLYRELIEYLKCDYVTLNEEKGEVAKLFDTIYKNDIYLSNLYEILENINISKDSRLRFKKICSDIFTDYKKILEEIEVLRLQNERNKNMVASANRVKLCFRHGIPISQNKYDIPNIRNIINYYQLSGRISNKKEVLLINEIELYNRNTVSKTGSELEKKYSDRIYNEIPNILNAGYYLYHDPKEDDIEIAPSRKKTIDDFAKTIRDSIKDVSNEKMIEEIKRYYDYYKLSDNEYKYIIIKLLDNYFFELRTYYEMLIDKDIYINRGNREVINRNNREVIVSGYYSVLDKFLYLFGYYDNLNKMLTMDEIVVFDVSDNFLPDEEKELVYSHSKIDITKAKIFKDMKNVPHEYYDRVLRLLMTYKDNTILAREVKRIRVKNYLNFLELKDDQVRIIIKHLKNNIYAVMGVFTKKDDNDPVRYDTIVRRELPDISTPLKQDAEIEVAKGYEEELFKLVNDKGRKGNR